MFRACIIPPKQRYNCSGSSCVWTVFTHLFLWNIFLSSSWDNIIKISSTGLNGSRIQISTASTPLVLRHSTLITMTVTCRDCESRQQWSSVRAFSAILVAAYWHRTTFIFLPCFKGNFTSSYYLVFYMLSFHIKMLMSTYASFPDNHMQCPYIFNLN